MKDLIYFDNLPMYEKYEFIDTHNDLYSGLNLTSRSVDNLYIKGINRINREEKTIPLEDFIIALKYTYQITENIDLKDRYVFKNYFELIDGLELEELKLISSISNSLNKLAYFNTIPSVDKTINTKIIDMGQELLDDLIILYDEIRLDIYPYLYKLDDTIASEINLLDKECCSIVKNLIFDDEDFNFSEIKEIQTMCVEDLNSILDELSRETPIQKIEIILNNSLKKELSNNKIKDLKYINNINYYGSDMKSFMTFLFEDTQLKDIKKAIIPFIEKFGFPYYNNNNEDIIPCNILIENSIFYYMYYTLFSDWQTADKRILEVFDFIPKEKFKKSKELENKTFFQTNRKSIIFYKNNWLRYNDFVCHDILGMKYCYKEVKDVTNYNDNHFNIIGKNGFNYKIVFYNLCTAMNMLLQEKTDYFTTDTKIDNCKFCGKE